MLIESVIVAIIGLIAGGIVNALSDDLPLRRSVRLPRYVPLRKKFAIHSSDPEVRATTQDDDEPRPLLAWLGLTAFLFGKRTSPTGIKLGWRYPLTEILTMGLMLLTLDAVTDNPDLTNVGTLQLIFWLIYMAIFALVVVIDIEHKLILFVVIIPSAILAIVDAFLTTVLPDSFGMKPPDLPASLLGGALGFLMFFMLYNGGALFTYVLGKMRGEKINEVAFGYGDVMMATVSGLILGWGPFIIAIIVIIFLGAFGAAIYLISRRLLGQRYSAYTALPYGPYIVAGTILMLLYRVPVTDFVLNR